VEYSSLLLIIICIIVVDYECPVNYYISMERKRRGSPSRL